jgi:2-hydroxy-3-keto-5-methylthiopentenyl-1-phosphate phosphatase
MIEQSISRKTKVVRGAFAKQSAPAPVNSSWMVQSDFDGTISLRDVTDTVLERFARPGWQEIETSWERGEIGSRECMSRQIALLDMSLDELHAHLQTIEIDPLFPSFVAAAHDQGMPVQVVSDGMDYVIRFILERHGLGGLEVMANRLVQIGERSWRLDSPHASPDCARASGTCKCERMAEQRTSHGHVLYIGDASSDFCVSGKADFVLAKSRLIDYCIENDIVHAPIVDFGEAKALLTELVVPLRVSA